MICWVSMNQNYTLTHSFVNAPSYYAFANTWGMKLIENQTEFWSRFGVTQSGGSRYESGREVPAPVAILVLAFADGLLDEAALARLRNLAG